MTRLLTVSEAAAEIGRRPEWVRERLVAGVIEGAFRERGRWYVPAASLESYVGQGMPDPAPADPIRLAPRHVRALGERRVA